MSDVWQGLLASLAIVVAVVALWTHLRDVAARRGKRFEVIALGLVMGGGAVLAMILSFRVTPGIIFDLRVAPLAVAGFFGGPLGAVVAVGPALLYRAWLGGAGVLAGCVAIVLATGLAALFRLFLGTRQARNSDLLLLAVVSAVGAQLSALALPHGLFLPMLLHAGIPAGCLNVLGVILAALSLHNEERRRELMTSNAVYRAVIEALPDCLNVKDAQGRFLVANPATARLMRAGSPDDLIGKTDFHFYPEATARQFREEERRALARDQNDLIEQHARFADGGEVWLSTLKVPFRDTRGAIVGLITHNRDITATKLLQLDLQTARQHLSDALAHMADGLVMYDSHARVVICNQQFRSMFPMTADLRVPGAALADILRGAIARGEQTLADGITVETWIETILAGLKERNDCVIALVDGRWLEARTRPVADGGCLTVFSDVTARKQREDMLRHRAEHDPLTGLANRAAFMAALTDVHSRSCAERTEFCVMLVDLDRFKQVNDTFGHAVGDKLLIEIGRRIQGECRQGDLVARLGGDEFAVLCEGGMDTGAPRLAQRIIDGLTTPFNAGSITLLPSGSIGFALSDPSGDPEVLILHADEALYAAKGAGRGRWVAHGGNLQAIAAA